MSKKVPSHFFRRTFFTGLLILIPLYITYILIAFLFDLFTGVGAPVVKGLFHTLGLDRYSWAEPLVPLVKVLLSLAVILWLGLFGTNILGRRMLEAFEALLMRLPVVRTIYSAAKQIVETFRGPARSFQQVVLVQYPTKGFWMMGLVAAERPDTMNLTSSDKVLSVFIPTTPNPTSGFLVLVASEDVVEVNYSVEEAFKFIVSSGIVGREMRAATSSPSVVPPSVSEPSRT
jgi:uncharacterized membrane protein